MSNYRKEGHDWQQCFTLKEKNKENLDLNLFNKKFYYVEQDCWISLSICANGLRIINKKGLDAALKDAVAKGYCDWKSIKVIG